MSAEQSRNLSNLIKSGVIHSVSDDCSFVRVQIGKLETNYLPYFVPAAGAISVHRVPSVGESCLVLSESGDLENGVVLCGIASNQYPTPSNNPDVHITKYKDGAIFSYDQSSGALTVSGVKAVNVTAKTSFITCPQNTIKGDVEIDGGLTVKKQITGAGGLAISGSAAGAGGASATFKGDISHSEGTITSTNIIQDGHKHKVTAVGSLTGEPTK